jgi:phosphoribosylpyrophosphate synthetase
VTTSGDWEVFLCSGAEHLEDELVRAGYSVSKSDRNYDGSRKFANGDVYTRVAGVELYQGKRVCVMQSFTSSGEQSAHNFTTGDRVVEALQVLDVLTRPRSVQYGGDEEREHRELDPPSEIVLLALHLPFSKQDQIYKTGESNACHSALRALFAAGAGCIVTIDPHVPPEFGWFKEYVDSGRIRVLHMTRRVIEELRQRSEFKEIAVVTTPGKKRLSIGEELLQVDKKRVSTHEVLLEGRMDEALQGKSIFLVDDMVISGTTIKNARKFLLAQGAREVYCWITHALPYAIGKEENLRRLVDAFDEKLFVSNTVRSATFQNEYPRCQVSCVPLIAEELLAPGGTMGMVGG